MVQLHNHLLKSVLQNQCRNSVYRFHMGPPIILIKVNATKRFNCVYVGRVLAADWLWRAVEYFSLCGYVDMLNV